MAQNFLSIGSFLFVKVESFPKQARVKSKPRRLWVILKKGSDLVLLWGHGQVRASRVSELRNSSASERMPEGGQGIWLWCDDGSSNAGSAQPLWHDGHTVGIELKCAWHSVAANTNFGTRGEAIFHTVHSHIRKNNHNKTLEFEVFSIWLPWQWP